jgi:cysteine dioxygenase
MQSLLLSKSPNLVTAHGEFLKSKSAELSLEEFIAALPETIHQVKKKDTTETKGDYPDLIADLMEYVSIHRIYRHAIHNCLRFFDRLSHMFLSHDFVLSFSRRLVLDPEDYVKYAHYDPSRNYTRNLVSSDGTSYTLLFLCWNPGRESPIHDHPCDGCWMRVCAGTLQESRFVKNPATDTLECTLDEIYQGKTTILCSCILLAKQDVQIHRGAHLLVHYLRPTTPEGDSAYIQDSMGYHKVGNPSQTIPAISLHLYCPPFSKCKIWMDANQTKPSQSCVCYYSEYGTIVE